LVEEQKKPHVTLSMCVRNEASRYLRAVLEDARHYIDAAVIIDDASTDDTVAVCRELLNTIPLRLVCNQESKFHHESDLRTQQWQETIATNPDWILVLDADEIFEDAFKQELPAMLARADVDVYYFRLFDMWNDTHYRQDPYWDAHCYYRPFLVRYKKDKDYKWQDKMLHCGRFPATIQQCAYACSPIRLKHYGWSRAEDRKTKYLRYKELDPDGIYGIKEQYESILDEHPTLLAWRES
jgi:glycosyltransferase involved in cell wall biosynthesis